VLAYFLYTWGLEKTESSIASVIATVEPIVATLVGLIIYSETIGGIQIVGTLLILISVIIVNLPKRGKGLAASENIKKAPIQ